MADTQAEFCRGAGGIRCDFHEAQAVLVPEHRAAADAGKDTRVLDPDAAGHHALGGRDAARAYPRKGVAVMVNVDDLGKGGGTEAHREPGRLPEPGRLALAAREHRGHRREKIAPVKRYRYVTRPPADDEEFALLRP